MSGTSGEDRRFSAGRRGEKVRSDLHVALSPRPSGGIRIELDSKVAPYYGAAIESQVRELLERFGVEHALVEVADQGALPFAITARVEAAALRAGLTLPSAAPFDQAPPPTVRDRLRRSRLYLPGGEPKFMAGAGLYGADGVILDLEDSVHPEEKDAARRLVASALRGLDFGGAERMVRINQGEAGLEDLEAVIPAQPDLILIPKVERPEQVRRVEEKIAALQQELGTSRPIWLMPILESALGLEHAFAIATASESNVALTIGVEDYTADLGVVKTRGGAESLWARARLINAAKAAGLQAIDSVFGDVADIEGLAAWAEGSRALGFEGMGCIHPRQIPVIHRAYAPGEEEIARALRIVEAFEKAQEEGKGVVSLGSKMIDAPVVLRAVALVRRARAMGLIGKARGESQ